MSLPRALPPPEELLGAYAHGLFPMAHDDGHLYWHDPDPRAIFPLQDIRPNARLRRFTRNEGYHCTVDRCFTTVMASCADRPSTWITPEMIAVYTALHRGGYAHSVETWHGDLLIGGIYGISIGGAFFGESMFSRAPNASKVAFHFLAAHLREQGFSLFDTQYINDHTRMLGALEIPREHFRVLLADALRRNVSF
ncbi:MAG: leucyl/phenylalanyl-tRNA--protein transferase [Flavobacteriales bacterium]